MPKIRSNFVVLNETGDTMVDFKGNTFLTEKEAEKFAADEAFNIEGAEYYVAEVKTVFCTEPPKPAKPKVIKRPF